MSPIWTPPPCGGHADEIRRHETTFAGARGRWAFLGDRISERPPTSSRTRRRARERLKAQRPHHEWGKWTRNRTTASTSDEITPLPSNASKKTLPHLSRSQNSDADISQHKQTYASKLIHEVRQSHSELNKHEYPLHTQIPPNRNENTGRSTFRAAPKISFSQHFYDILITPLKPSSGTPQALF